MYKIKHETGNDYWSIFFNGTWIEQFRAKSRSKKEMQGLLNDINCRMGRYTLHPKYKILQLFTYGWDDTYEDEDGKPLRFDTIDEAMRDIRDTIESTEEAFKNGDMSDAYSYDDYKIVPEWFAPHANNVKEVENE